MRTHLAAILCFAACSAPDAPTPVGSLEPRLAVELGARGFELDAVTVTEPPAGKSGRIEVRWGGVPLLQFAGKRTRDGETIFPMLRWAAEVPELAPRIDAASAERTAAAGLDRGAEVKRCELVLDTTDAYVLRPGHEGGTNSDDYERVITRARLVWRVELEHAGLPYVALVDAASGEQLSREAQVLEVVEYRSATGRGWFNGGTSSFPVVFEADNAQPYRLIDQHGNRYYASTTPGTTVPYRSADHRFGDGQLYSQANGELSANGETAAVDTLVNIDRTWSMLADVLDRNGPSGDATPMDVVVHTGFTTTGYLPGIRTLQIGWANGQTPNSVMAMGSLDVVAHELGHDVYHSLVYSDDPGIVDVDFSDAQGLDEGTGDIFGFLAEVHRDSGGQVDTWVPRSNNLLIGDEVQPDGIRSMLTPDQRFWRPGAWPTRHAGAGPIDRWFMLLVYGSAFIKTTAPTSPFLPPPPPPPQPLSKYLPPPNTRGVVRGADWQCPLYPQGFAGLGVTRAARLWECTLDRLPPAASYADARAAALGCARRQALESVTQLPLPTDISPTELITAAAFSCIAVGMLPDRDAPDVSLSCAQGSGYVDCVGRVTDDEPWSPALTQPKLQLDSQPHVSVNGWQFSQRFSTIGLSEGSHTVTARAWDAWNREGSAIATFLIDTTPPTASVTITGPQKQPVIQVTASDPSGVAQVEFTDPPLFVSDPVAPYTYLADTSARADGVYAVAIRVTDRLGNATTLLADLRADNTAPAVSVQVSGSGPSYTVTGTATDASPIAKAELLLDGAVIATKASAPYTFSYTPSTGGAHTLAVRATDSYGNEGQASTAAPRDTTPPTATFTPFQSGSTMRIDVTVDDPCGITMPYGFYLDGALFISLSTTPASVFLASGLSPGPHTASVVVTDRCGNTATLSAPFVKENASPPVITGITRNDADKKKPVFTVDCFSQSGVHHVEVRRNGSIIGTDSAAPYQFTIDTSVAASWPDGTHSLVFQCSGNDGLASQPETRTVEADNTGPSFVFSVWASGRQHVLTPGSIGDAHGVASVSYSSFAFSAATFTASPYAYSLLLPASFSGSTLVTVTAKDTWNNSTTESWVCDFNTNVMTARYLTCTKL